MSLIDWLNMNLILDISFLVFAAAATIKLRKMQNKINALEHAVKTVIKNPQQARKNLKKFLE